MFLLILFCALGAGSRTGVVSASEGGAGMPATDLAGSYLEALEEREADVYADNSGFAVTIAPDLLEGAVAAADAHGYHGPAATWGEDGEVAFDVAVPSDGLYRFALDFFPLDDDHLDYELAVSVNGVQPFSEAGQIILYKIWDGGQTFAVDRYGNDFYASQSVIAEWTRQAFQDPMGFYTEPLSFFLEAGTNVVTFRLLKGEFLLGDVTVTGLADPIPYAQYAAGAALAATTDVILVEAETPEAKNSSSIQAGVSRDPGVTPFEVSILKLNILSGTSWNSERETVTYAVDVPTAGFYRLTFKARQATYANAAAFRTIRINGAIPFAEAVAIPFPYSRGWTNVTPSDATGNAYLFRLDAGRNEISLSVDLSMYRATYATIQTILREVNQLSLDVRKLTGNQVDEDRDWSIVDYMPSVESDLRAMAAALSAEIGRVDAMNGSTRRSEIESSLAICVRNLNVLADKPDEIPKNITMLSASSSSIASILGQVVAMLVDNPLDLDRIYVHGAAEVPAAEAGFLQKAWLAVRRFFLSFFEDRYSDLPAEGELEVWVNRSKQYVDLIQKLADERFTTATGIPVKVSVMSSESKLILANSAGRNPDVALGIASWMPYDMGIRGAVYDLSAFSDDPGFAETLSLYHPEALIPMVYDEGLYGLPDTENFYVLFYRADILESIGVGIPDTWEDVTEILPVLKRYGLDFYIPLSGATSLKAFDATLPFLFQYGSSVYDADAFGSAIDDSASIGALTMMTELYTIYSMDVTVSSFYNDFRLGTCPIGVGDFGMYVTLLNAAPDIQGLWRIALLPGVEKNGGDVDRSAPGAATANIVFKNTESPDESWAFLKWWASTATQVEFESLLLSTLGRSYLWNAANQEAFMAAGYADADVAVIAAQWDWLRELPKVPGSYQVELEISNLWNSVVLERANLRVELNDAVIRADKEIRKKMAEFGYMDKAGNVLKPYVKATRSLIDAWRGGGGDA